MTIDDQGYQTVPEPAPTVNPVPPMPPKKKSNTWWIVLLIVVILLCCCLAIVGLVLAGMLGSGRYEVNWTSILPVLSLV